MLLVHQTHKLFFLECPIYSMNRFCLQRTLESTLKQSCSQRKFEDRNTENILPKNVRTTSRASGIYCDFEGCDRQFDWLEISLPYDESNKHLTIYDTQNAECAAIMIKKKIELSNISEAYSATNMMKFNISKDTQKNLLWKQYLA